MFHKSSIDAENDLTEEPPFSVCQFCFKTPFCKDFETLAEVMSILKSLHSAVASLRLLTRYRFPAIKVLLKPILMFPHVKSSDLLVTDSTSMCLNPDTQSPCCEYFENELMLLTLYSSINQITLKRGC